jgi:hypothetical protein
VFTGDSFGVSYRECDTENGEFIFPTTTPTSFDPEQAHIAVDRIMACNPDKLYLTHYSRVTDVERLAADMHARIDDFASLALAHKDDEDRGEQIRQAVDDYLAAQLIGHGFRDGRGATASLLKNDVTLNAQGLVSWLERLERHDG